MRQVALAWSGVGLVLAACLVPDVELVERLPTPGQSGGATSQAGKAGTSQAGASAELAGEGGGTNTGAGGTSEVVQGGAPEATFGGAGGADDAPDNSGLSCSKLGSHACSGESCCTSLLVEGCSDCEFPEGYTSTTVSDFRLDKYEVTVGRFRAFAEAYQGPPAASQGAQPSNDASGWQSEWDAQMATTAGLLRSDLAQRPCQPKTIHTWTKDVGDNELMPMNCVSWYEAFAFCVWDGGFLPSELQWQYAASGGTEYRLYPWDDNNLDIDHALYGACGNGVSATCDETSILPVGSKPAGVGKWGHLDLIGSMWEWIVDTTATAFPIEQPCVDCMNVGPGYDRAIRGGSWPEDSSFMPAAHRQNDPPASIWYNVGIRCARLP